MISVIVAFVSISSPRDESYSLTNTALTINPAAAPIKADKTVSPKEVAADAA